MMQTTFVQSVPFTVRPLRRAISPLSPRKHFVLAAMGPFVWFQNLVRATSTAKSMTATPIAPPSKHVVLSTPIAPPPGGWEPPLQEAMFGLGCFWGAERKFWQTEGVYTTSVGYAGGETEFPTYRQVCSGRTGHAEVVNLVYDTSKTSYEDVLNVFWETHDPTQKNRQGNDVGTQYRSVIYYYNEEQRKAAEETRNHFNTILKEAGRNGIATEIQPAPQYFYAEEYHQQYLHKNPMGYCGLGGTGLYKPRKN
eukprot:gb/GEZJ01000639.1/.p1 GENE.gb/GEZJ01000639.1/~~gb/GEZJ01000639.1/.p1  ORF type:complete len:252 (-),score=25.28 gb/GEZJ01000639.1/:854-1609(-)